MKNNTESRNVCLRWVAMAALTIPFLLLCSCSAIASAKAHKWNFGYPGDPRPADEAILTGRQTYDPKKNTVGDPLISKLDDHSCSIMAPRWNGRGPIGTESFEVRLMPGIHKLRVEPIMAGAMPTFLDKSKPITFEAIARRHYDLKLELTDRKAAWGGVRIKWDAKITEVETGKEFHLDTQ